MRLFRGQMRLSSPMRKYLYNIETKMLVAPYKVGNFVNLALLALPSQKIAERWSSTLFLYALGEFICHCFKKR